jgi:hypothetical protein
MERTQRLAFFGFAGTSTFKDGQDVFKQNDE